MTTSEAQRLEALASYCVLDSAPEAAFDRITALAAQLFQTPIALVSLVDSERQWFKSRLGLDVPSTDRKLAFCTQAIEQGPYGLMVVPDATADPRFQANPLVVGAPHIGFYAGAVLTTADGYNLGTLCVIDRRPRHDLQPQQFEPLRTLARVVVDALELRRAKRSALEKQRLLNLVESMSGVGRWRRDLVTGRTTWTDAVYDIFGVSRSDFIPTGGGADFCHPDDREGMAEKLAGLLTRQEPFELRSRICRPNGEVRHVLSHAVCEVDDQGRPIALSGVVQDVTGDVLNLIAAQESEARYRLLAENARDVILHANVDSAITYISPAVAEMAGYAPAELIGRSWLEMIDPEDVGVVRAAKRAQVEAGCALAPETVEYRLRRRDGSLLWVEGRPALAVDARTGAVTGITDVVRDVSARKLAEQALREARAEAESQAATKAEFLSNMSHELRTPMTAVIGFAQLIQEQPELSEKTRSYLARLSNGGRSLLALVNDILDFSKLEAGQVEIQARPVDPARIAREALDLFTLMAADKGLTLEAMGLENLPPTVALDADRVRQVLLNLIGNAVKFTDQGSVRLEAAYDAVAGRLGLRIWDTGPGISAEAANRLFQRFSQVDGGSARRHGGTGLGLAICKGLVEAMDGEIGVESQTGRGACFWFTLPAAEVAAAQAEPTAADAAVVTLSGWRILVVDDNPVNRALVRAVLAPFDVTVDEAGDGLEAVRVAEQAPFDVILMDLRMPGLNGDDAARQIRSGSGPNRITPIIAFSADVTGHIADGLFDGCVTKPISASALVEAIVNVASSGDAVWLTAGDLAQAG